jgi:hypothetical protein
MKWLIETNKEAPPEIDDFVQGLEDLLNTHIELRPIVNPEAAKNPLEWTTGLLEGVTFIQTMLFNDPNRATLIQATLNIANIALTFNRSLTDGAYSELGIRQVVQPDAPTVHIASGQTPEVQGDSQDLPQPAQDQHVGMVSDGSPSSPNGDDQL